MKKLIALMLLGAFLTTVCYGCKKKEEKKENGKKTDTEEKE